VKTHKRKEQNMDNNNNITINKTELIKQINCVKKEIMFRENVYRKLVKTSKMSAKVAMEEIELMKGVLNTLESLLNDNNQNKENELWNK
jgi:hypothetical protein